MSLKQIFLLAVILSLARKSIHVIVLRIKNFITTSLTYGADR